MQGGAVKTPHLHYKQVATLYNFLSFFIKFQLKLVKSLKRFDIGISI